MSITLPFVDLSSAVVGTSGSMPLQAVGLVAVPSQQPPHLAIFNDSGAGLLIQLTVSGQQFYLSAKGHILVAISNKETDIKYQVQNVATNIQVNQLWAVYFYPGEKVTDFSALGTSTVSQQAVTLQNLGNPVGNNVIFIEPLGDTSTGGVFNVKNDGSMTIGDNLHGGSIQVLSTTASTNTIISGGDVAGFDGFGAGLGGFDLNGTGANPKLSLTDSAGNNIINMIAMRSQINGSTSGTATMYMIHQGFYKYALIYLNNFRNGGGSTQTMAFPVAFNGCYARTSSWPAGQLLLAGVAQTVNIITTLAVGGGTPTTATVFGGYSFFDCATGSDTLSFNSGQVTPHTGFMIIEGV